MTTQFEIKKIASTLICTVLFGATCVLSAVGPARAIETSNPAATHIIAGDISPAVRHLA